jgi:hypothetical protein
MYLKVNLPPLRLYSPDNTFSNVEKNSYRCKTRVRHKQMYAGRNIDVMNAKHDDHCSYHWLFAQYESYKSK